DPRAQVNAPVTVDLYRQVAGQGLRGEARPVEIVGSGRGFLEVLQDELLLVLGEATVEGDEFERLVVGFRLLLGESGHGHKLQRVTCTNVRGSSVCPGICSAVGSARWASPWRSPPRWDSRTPEARSAATGPVLA